MELATQYASVDEIGAYWRPLSDGERSRADDLLTRAATLINELPGASAFVLTACNAVSLDMVKRAMIGGAGVTEQSQAMADLNVNQHFANPMGNLYITAAERHRLAGYPSAAGSLTLSSNVRVPGQPWNHQNSSQTEAD